MDEIEAKLLDFFRGVRDQAHPVFADEPGTDLSRWAVSFAGLFNGDTETEDWLLEPALARGRAHALYAAAKVGKSWVMLHLAAALATGREVLRRPAGEPVHVLYVDYEMTAADLLERMEAFGYTVDDAPTLDRYLHYILLPSIPALDTDEGGDLLARAVVHYGAELVVIDTTMRSVNGEENSADTINAFYRCTGLRLKALGVTWVRLDHAGKDMSKGQRGTSAKDGDVDLVLRLERVEDGVTIRATHKRVQWYPELTAYTVTNGDEWPTRITVTGDEVRLWADGTKEVADLLDELGQPVDISVRGAAKALREAGQRITQKVVADAVRWRREPQRVLRNTEISPLRRNTEPEIVKPASIQAVTPCVTLRNSAPGKSVTPPPVRVGVTQPRPDGPPEYFGDHPYDPETDPW